VAALDGQIKRLEGDLVRTAKVHDPQTFARLRSVPGIGPVLALILLYEVQSITRFEHEGQFLSYARLVGGVRESAGKSKGTGGRKIGNAHLKWAFGEAACLMLRESAKAKTWVARKERKVGTPRALGGVGVPDRPDGLPPVAEAGVLRRGEVPGELVGRPGEPDAERGHRGANA